MTCLVQIRPETFRGDKGPLRDGSDSTKGPLTVTTPGEVEDERTEDCVRRTKETGREQAEQVEPEVVEEFEIKVGTRYRL